MKIISWNCNGALRKKYRALDQFDADLLVIQECEDPVRSILEYEKWAGKFLWIGHDKNKGVGIFAKRKTQLTALDWGNDGLQLFLPCRVNDNFNLVGVWTKNPESRQFRYIGQLWKYLQLRKQEFVSDSTVLCGDFNSNADWDNKHKGCSHSDVVKMLGHLNFRSIYHQVTGEEQGLEKTPTQFMHRKVDRPYHIDYAFVSNNLLEDNQSLYVGEAREWLQHSDHMPLVFSICDNLNQP